MDRDLLIQELERDEGLRLNAYRDSLGYWTIGIGHLLGATARMTSITRAEAYALLAADIDEAEGIARAYAPTVEADPVRWRVLVNMAFNLGNKLGQFKRFLGAVAEEDWEHAATFMLQSLWAKQVGARAVRLSEMMRKGKAPE